MTVGSDGRLWTGSTDTGLGTIFAISTDGTVEQVSLFEPSEGVVAITSSPGWDIWFALKSGKVGRLPINGTPSVFAVPWSAQFTEIGGIIVGPDNNLWITQSTENSVTRMTLTGSITQFIVPREGAGPGSLTVGSDGNIWFVERGATTDRIGRMTLSGSLTEFALPRRSTPTELLVATPWAITSGLDGNIWFTELQGSRIGRITLEGILTEFDLPTPSSRPVGITAGPDGNVWFAEQGSNKIGRISPNGEIVEFAFPGSCPEHIVTGPDGNVWFTEGCGRGKVARLQVSSVLPPAAVPATSAVVLLLLAAALSVVGVLRAAV